MIVAEEERYTGVMAMDWEDTYVCIITLVLKLNQIFRATNY